MYHQTYAACADGKGYKSAANLKEEACKDQDHFTSRMPAVSMQETYKEAQRVESQRCTET